MLDFTFYLINEVLSKFLHYCQLLASSLDLNFPMKGTLIQKYVKIMCVIRNSVQILLLSLRTAPKTIFLMQMETRYVTFALKVGGVGVQMSLELWPKPHGKEYFPRL